MDFSSLRSRVAPLQSHRVVMLFSLLLVALYNWACWHSLNQLIELEGLKRLGFQASFAVLLWAAFTFLLLPFSFRPLLKPVLSVLMLGSAAAAYFMTTYGVSIDTVMMQNVIETNPGEVADLVNGRLVAFLLVLGVLPIVLLWWWPVRYKGFFGGLFNKIALMIGCLVLVAASVGCFYSIYAPLFREEDKLTHFINPTNFIYGGVKHLKERYGEKKVLVVQQIGDDARLDNTVAGSGRRKLMIFVVGETARADHFSLNGYARLTNPELSQLDVLNFAQVRSCGTSTAVSVPCMFSMFPRTDYSDKKGKTYEGLLDVMQRAGVQVLWLENNSDCKGTCLRVPNRDIPKSQPSPYCDGKNCLDESLLVGLQDDIDNSQGNLLVVLHSDGSHGPEYYDRYPKDMERFTPVCHTNQLGSCSRDEVVNVYDNTILYTDHFLAKVIDLLKHNENRFDTGMWYVSDHGESLGENGLYLHAAPYAIAPEAQTHVPMVMWFGPGTLANLQIDRGCLARKRDDQLSHDYVFHSLLGYMGVATGVYQQDLDLFRNCRR